MSRSLSKNEFKGQGGREKFLEAMILGRTFRKYRARSRSMEESPKNTLRRGAPRASITEPIQIKRHEKVWFLRV